MDIRIYTCTHKKFDPPADELYIPLHVGRKISDDLGYVGDDTGESISEKNKTFCELTGLFWVWKNVDCDVVGICHYRRYLVRDGRLLDKEYIKKVLFEEDYDVIVPASGFTDYGTNLNHYDRIHYMHDWEVTRDVLFEKYPEYREAYDLFCGTNLASLANMIIAKKEIYNEYCEWLYDILFEVEKRTDVSDYDTYQARLYGYLSERLFRIWLFNHDYKVREEQVMLVEGNQAVSAAQEVDKISVVVPCYNRENYIRECVDSLVEQTYPLQGLELIFVDDGSTDNTVDILKEYEEKYPENILIVELSENTGCPGNVRNIGMQYVSGKYLMFVDSDDYVDRDILEKMYAIAIRDNADIVSANMQLFSGEDILLTEERDDRTFNTENPQDLFDLLASEGSDGHIGARLYRTDFIMGNAIAFPEGRHVAEDTFFNMACIMQLRIYSRISDVVYHYRFNDQGMWRSDSQPPEQIMECLATQEELLPLYKARLSGAYEVVEWFFFNAVGNLRSRLISMGQESFYRDRLSEIRTRLDAAVPNLKTNRFVAATEDENLRSLYGELF